LGLSSFIHFTFLNKRLKIVSMDKIIIKEIDKYNSLLFNGKTVSEYIIYLMSEDGVKKEAYLEIGEEAKKLRVNELLMNNFDYNEHIIDDIILEQTI
jgi:hypothetical protein